MTSGLNKWLKLPSLGERLRALNVREDLVVAAERTAFGRPADRDLPALESQLSAAEAVIQLVEGRHTRSIGLLALTSRRLVFVSRAAGQVAVSEVDLAEIVSIGSRIRRGMGTLEVSTSGPESFVVDQILGTQAESLAASIEAARLPPQNPPSGRRDALEELAELRTLHRAGLLDDTEFMLRKQRLFDQI